MEKKIKDKYFESIGRRKTSTARVRITNASKQSFIVNGKDFKEYFKKYYTKNTDAPREISESQ